MLLQLQTNTWSISWQSSKPIINYILTNSQISCIMPIIDLPYFGPLNTASIEEYYESGFEQNNNTITIDLNFENNTIDEERLYMVKRFLENIPAWMEKTSQYIQDNLNNEDDNTVREYADFLFEVMDEADLAELIDLEADPEERVAQIAEKLHLARIGLYPDGDDQFAIFDYTIGSDLVDNLVVIHTDENGVLDYMTIES